MHSRPLITIQLCCGDVFHLEAVVVVMFMVEVQRADSFKQFERLLVCLRLSEHTESLFSVQVHLHSSVPLCVQRVLDKLCEAFEVVVLRTDSYKQLEQLLVCLRACGCIEGLFSVQVHLHSSAQMCVQECLMSFMKPLKLFCWRNIVV